ncbi:hypothetical protein GW17_00009079 [Ensete ventricosum]|nr:hypothetical protein GW17_00009079 [Ensete ventricosum]
MAAVPSHTAGGTSKATMAGRVPQPSTAEAAGRSQRNRCRQGHGRRSGRTGLHAAARRRGRRSPRQTAAWLLLPQRDSPTRNPTSLFSRVGPQESSLGGPPSLDTGDDTNARALTQGSSYEVSFPRRVVVRGHAAGFVLLPGHRICCPPILAYEITGLIRRGLVLVASDGRNSGGEG